MKPSPLFFLIEGVLALLLIWSLSFFRDPERIVPLDESVFLSTADGKVTDITFLEKDSPLGVPTIRIGIFLSIFNVHINGFPVPYRFNV
jgi:phosphatidylserine decarboxylase